MSREGGETKPSLEVRIENRAGGLGGDIKTVANRMKDDGFSEHAIAGHCTAIENLNDLAGTVNLKGSEKEKFLLEVQQAIRALVHGLTMGDQAQRGREQLNIANGSGELSRQVSAALRKANGTGMSGGQETVLNTEHEV